MTEKIGNGNKIGHGNEIRKLAVKKIIVLVGGWMGGCVGVQAVLRNAYSNQKL